MKAIEQEMAKGKWHDNARLYKLDPPCEYEDGHTEYVITSGIYASDHEGLETYIFPADAKGNCLDWQELKGSFCGEINHERALKGLGYDPIEEA